ncbi:hypothetical protein ACP26L_24565 [Paenibacillus sp. S-38]|uniref:hypothetical protein n=1 Tax=Paenibacillus sp. S-38 TaxID=3416710 RepID=UPI003CE79F79
MSKEYHALPFAGSAASSSAFMSGQGASSDYGVLFRHPRVLQTIYTVRLSHKPAPSAYVSRSRSCTLQGARKPVIRVRRPGGPGLLRRLNRLDGPACPAAAGTRNLFSFC